MKKRWMASILETSRRTNVALPFHRSVRKTAKAATQVRAAKKSA